MATATILNISPEPVFIRDLYDSLEPGESVALERSLGELGGMLGLHAALADGTISLVSLVITPEEALFSASGGSGWVNITNIAVPSGVASAQVWADPPNNTVLQSCTISDLGVLVTVKCSSPLVSVGGVSSILPPGPSGGHYVGTVPLTLTGPGSIVAQLTTSDGAQGAADTCDIAVAVPPAILSLTFVGGYPGAQTELKAGDTFQIQGTTSSPSTGIEVQNFGAGTLQTITFASTTTFVATITIADRGTSPQSLVARVRARDAAGAYGATFDTSNTVILNNLFPTATFGTKTYPVSQAALKNAETADVAVTLANLSSVSFTSPNGDLSIASPTVIATSKTVARIAGSYNVATNNLQVVATRAANGAVTTTQTVVAIANVAPTVNLSVPAARLRSGGNDGTSVQSHTVIITADQQLLNAPTLSAGAGGGTFVGGGFAGGPTVWTRSLNVSDSDTKGAYSFSALVATGLAGLVQSTINSGAAYTLGGFVPRNLTFPAFSQSTALNVAVVTYSKLQAGTFTATAAAAIRYPVQGDLSNLANNFTVLTLGANPTTLFWNDATAASTNSSGTAQILVVEETV